MKNYSFFCLRIKIRYMKSFVHIHTSFFVGTKLSDFDICIDVKNLSVFLQSFTSFYERMNWHFWNKDLPLQFCFEFTDNPRIFPNRLNISGFKPDISVITYSFHIAKVLSKSK